jgi:putative ABC transport system permease protein
MNDAKLIYEETPSLSAFGFAVMEPSNTDPYMDVVGVVGDLKYWGLESESKPAYYRPYTQNFNTTIFLLVQSPKPAAGLAPSIQREIRTVDKNAVVRRVLTLEDLLGESVAQPRFRTLLVTSFGVLALMLAAVAPLTSSTVPATLADPSGGGVC